MDWLTLAMFSINMVLLIVLLRYRVLYFRASTRESGHRDLIENLSEGVYHSSLDGRQLSANQALVALNGYDNEPEMLESVRNIATEWYVDPDRRSEFQSILARDGRVEDFVSEIHRHKTRERIWISESARLVRNSRTGKPQYYEGSIREITASVKQQQLDLRFRKLTSQVPGGLFQLVRSPGGKFTMPYANLGFRRMFDVGDDATDIDPEIMGRDLREADRLRLLAALKTSGMQLEPLVFESRALTKQGPERWIHITATPEHDGAEVVWHGYISDISERKKHQIKIEDLAYFDPLTHLPNRRLLIDRLTGVIADTNCSPDFGALLFIDLDNFKGLNDTHGHDVGDQLLIKVARRISKCVDADNLVARIGGDEFVVMLDGLQGGKDAASGMAMGVASKILNSLRGTFQLGPVEHLTSASIGVVVFDGSEGQIEELLKRSDVAMYEAKKNGRNAMALFDPKIMVRQAERHALLHDLRSAIHSGDFVLNYQPQVDRDGEITGAEALVRWPHAQFGLVAPDRFIPIAEETGLIRELDRLVVKNGLRTLSQWQSDDLTSHLKLSINVSAQTFVEAEFVPLLTTLIKDSGADSRALTLELTEHVMAEDTDLIREHMTLLKQTGVRFSLDDFGTGFSSLSYLKKMPFDEVKIDGAFVADISNDEKDRALLKTILGMADTLGLVAVAEHVETTDQEQFLRAHDCRHFQGYLYGAAMPADRIVERLAQRVDTPSPERSANQTVSRSA